MQTRLLQGAIQSSELPDLLLSLQVSCRTGRLRLEREGVSRELYLKAGIVVAADSSARDDALDWMLFTTGALTEERHAEVRAMIEAGARAGRALVESGSLSPVALCEWTERRARYLAGDVLAWRSGSYEFEEGAAPPPGAITVKVRPDELLLVAYRLEGSPSPSARLPSFDLVLEPVTAGAPGAMSPEALTQSLLPHESYVLGLADGRRKVSEICFLSEIGEAETLRTLALLGQAGCLRSAGPASARLAPEEPAGTPDLPLPVELQGGDSSAELRAVIRIYNELYSFVYAHMIKEVGPIAEQLLEKNLREVRDLHAALFNRAAGVRDGCLPEDTLMRNTNLIKDQNRRELLVTGMHDYLQAMVIAVRRILGPAHQGQVVRRLREMRCSRS